MYACSARCKQMQKSVMAALQATQPGDRWQARERWQSPVMASSKTEPRRCLQPASLSFVSLKGCLVPESGRVLQTPDVDQPCSHTQPTEAEQMPASPLDKPFSNGAGRFAKTFTAHRNVLVSVIRHNPTIARS